MSLITTVPFRLHSRLSVNPAYGLALQEGVFAMFTLHSCVFSSEAKPQSRIKPLLHSKVSKRLLLLSVLPNLLPKYPRNKLLKGPLFKSKTIPKIQRSKVKFHLSYGKWQELNYPSAEFFKNELIAYTAGGAYTKIGCSLLPLWTPPCK